MEFQFHRGKWSFSEKKTNQKTKTNQKIPFQITGGNKQTQLFHATEIPKYFVLEIPKHFHCGSISVFPEWNMFLGLPVAWAPKQPAWDPGFSTQPTGEAAKKLAVWKLKLASSLSRSWRAQEDGHVDGWGGFWQKIFCKYRCIPGEHFNFEKLMTFYNVKIYIPSENFQPAALSSSIRESELGRKFSRGKTLDLHEKTDKPVHRRKKRYHYNGCISNNGTRKWLGRYLFHLRSHTFNYAFALHVDLSSILDHWP